MLDSINYCTTAEVDALFDRMLTVLPKCVKSHYIKGTKYIRQAVNALVFARPGRAAEVLRVFQQLKDTVAIHDPVFPLGDWLGYRWRHVYERIHPTTFDGVCSPLRLAFLATVIRSQWRRTMRSTRTVQVPAAAPAPALATAPAPAPVLRRSKRSKHHHK